eukprot:Lankesteria_metandrocarpae@DN913_c0_g1_i1.p1
MVKKFAGGANQKAAVAKDRKEAVTSAKTEVEAKRAADEAWLDDDKHTNKKIKRKEDTIAKTEEKNARRAELKKLVEADDATMPPSKPSKAVDASTMTRAESTAKQMLLQKEKEIEIEERKKKEAKIESQSSLAMENPNIAFQDEVAKAAAEGKEYIGASGIDESVAASAAVASAYGVDAGADAGVLKQTFSTYSAEWKPKIRAENPKLKKSQVEEKLWKQWQKAPENPRRV